MTENSCLTITTEVRSTNQPAIVLSSSSTAQSTGSYPTHQLMGILYTDKGIAGNVLHQIKVCLKKTFTYNQIFNDRRKFTAYLASELIARKAVFIICSKLAESLYGLAEERPECSRIYILRPEHQLFMQSNLGAHQQVMKYLDEQFTQISNDIKAIELSPKDHTISSDDSENIMNAELSALSVFNSTLYEKSFRCLSFESLEFLLHQTYTEVLTNMEHERKSLDEMLHWCRGCYWDNTVELQKIDHFKDHYTPSTAIQYYTQDSFVFRQVNQAFRLEDIERIFTFRVYVTDLNRQITKRAETGPISQSHITLYRGKKQLNTILQQLLDNISKLISINGFLSTTQDIAVAESFAGVGQTREGYESAVFKLCIDTSRMLRSPYALIDEDSMNEDELEVLFTMGSVWLLERMERKNGYWLIELRSCDALDSQLTELKKLTNGYSFLSLGNISRELGQYSNAKNFYRRMLDAHPYDVEICRCVHYHMGLLAEELGEHMDMLDNFLKVAQMISITTAPNNSQSSNSRPLYACNPLKSRLPIWNNIARSYEKKGDFESARQYYIQALNEEGELRDKIKIYYNFGLFEYQQGNYEGARKYFTKVVEVGSDHEIMQNSQQKLKMIDDLFNRGLEAYSKQTTICE